MHRSDMLYLMAINRLPFLRTREKLLLLELCRGMEDFFSLSPRDLETILGRRFKKRPASYASYLREAERDCRFLEDNRSIGILSFWDPGYPAGLRELYEPPFLLFYRGRLPAFMDPLLAIVGTRQPTGGARSAAFHLAMELTQRGIGVISGLARGIDAEAHQGSLYGPGEAIAVLGNGIDRIYPQGNRKLGQQLLEQGGVIFSEFPPGTLPLRYNFPKRNRIISGMARGVVVIQAPSRSGALITADYALEQGRDIYVHQAGMEGARGAGNKKLAEQGAVVIENSAQLFYDWGWGDKKQPRIPGYAGDVYKKENPGLLLAARLECELNDQYILHNGDFIRRL